MKLFTSQRAPNPRRVRWVMAEKGIEDVEVIEVDILTGKKTVMSYLLKPVLKAKAYALRER